jgi:hypothetical protein
VSNERKIQPWTEDERALLDALLDTVIPAGAGLPGAGALGIADFLAEQVADAPEWGEGFVEGLGRAAAFMRSRGIENLQALEAQDREAVARELEASEPNFFSTLVRYTYVGYYTHPTIPPHFGLPDHPPQPEGNDLPPDDPALLDEMLQDVRSRGKIYRQC